MPSYTKSTTRSLQCFLHLIHTQNIYPPCLIGEDTDGTLLIRVPTLKIFSVGCSKKAFYYLTSMRESPEGVTRFWLFAFQCKSRHNANQLSTALIHACSEAREDRKERAKKLSGGSRQSVPGTPGTASYGGSWYEGSPHNSIVSAGSSSGASSMDNSPMQATPPSSYRTSNDGLSELVSGMNRLSVPSTTARRLLPLNLPGIPRKDSDDTDHEADYMCVPLCNHLFR